MQVSVYLCQSGFFSSSSRRKRSITRPEQWEGMDLEVLLRVFIGVLNMVQCPDSGEREDPAKQKRV